VRIALIGATGVLGRRAVPCLVGAGHDVVALTRDERGKAAVMRQGARPVRGDLLDAGTLQSALAGAEVVVNLASAIPAVPRPTPEHWAINDRVRREGTRNVLDAAMRTGVKHYVHASVYLVYGDDTGDEPVSESAPLRPAPAIQSAVDGEEAVRAADVGWTILRPGWLYDAGAWHTQELLRQLQASEAVVIEGAPAWRSPVHAVDVARAVELVVGHRPAGEVFNVADDVPVRTADMLDGLATLLGAPRPVRLGRDEASARLGPRGSAALGRSTRLATDRIRTRLGFAPRYARWRAGFGAILDRA
jgi:nucleoside-diphosphate-sugar epimerase